MDAIAKRDYQAARSFSYAEDKARDTLRSIRHGTDWKDRTVSSRAHAC
jgi:hypothetical protein